MNKQDRIKELSFLLENKQDELKEKGYNTFGDIHKRIEELMQRPTWTHELAYPKMLYDEILKGKKGEAFTKSLREIAKTKPILILGENK